MVKLFFKPRVIKGCFILRNLKYTSAKSKEIIAKDENGKVWFSRHATFYSKQLKLVLI